MSTYANWIEDLLGYEPDEATAEVFLRVKRKLENYAPDILCDEVIEELVDAVLESNKKRYLEEVRKIAKDIKKEYDIEKEEYQDNVLYPLEGIFED